MRSVCLNHQDREIHLRCKNCLRPVCEECAQQTPEGIFCSVGCHDKNVEKIKAIEEFNSREAAYPAPRRGTGWTAFLSTILTFGLLALIVILVWPYVPESWRQPRVRVYESFGF